MEDALVYMASNLPEYQLVKLPPCHHSLDDKTTHPPTGIYSVMTLLAHSYSCSQLSGQPGHHDNFWDLELFLFADSPALTFTLPVLLVKGDSNNSEVLSEGQLQLTSYRQCSLCQQYVPEVWFSYQSLSWLS